MLHAPQIRECGVVRISRAYRMPAVGGSADLILSDIAKLKEKTDWATGGIAMIAS